MTQVVNIHQFLCNIRNFTEYFRIIINHKNRKPNEESNFIHAISVIVCMRERGSERNRRIKWTGTMPDYYDEAVVVKVISQTKATFTVGSTTATFSYTYNSSLQTGTLTSEGDTFTFEIVGNKLILTDPYSDTYSFTRTK